LIRASAQTATRAPARRRRRGGRRRAPTAVVARRRRLKAIGAAVLVGGIAAIALTNLGTLERGVREFTLPLQHEDIIRQQAREKDVPADLIAAVIYNESRFRDQTSHAGARGLMQITPSTAKVIESLSGGQTFNFDDLSDPDINIRYGTFYLHYLIQKFGDNEIAALAAYNAGETNVAAWGGSSLSLDDTPFPETRDYVENVLEKRDEYARHYRHELGLD
jgi:soluble lytic murein transglycosylase